MRVIPLLAFAAVAGARVVSFGNADEQLAKDLAVASQHGLSLVVEQGDMGDLSRFADARLMPGLVQVP